MEEGSHRSLAVGLRPFVAVVVAVLAGLAIAPSSSFAAVCTPPVANPVACENAQTGEPQANWEVIGAGDDTIQGFGTTMSVNKGQTVSFKIKSETSDFHIDILRLGY